VNGGVIWQGAIARKKDASLQKEAAESPSAAIQGTQEAEMDGTITPTKKNKKEEAKNKKEEAKNKKEERRRTRRRRFQSDFCAQM
jgi:hypothetical protein